MDIIYDVQDSFVGAKINGEEALKQILIIEKKKYDTLDEINKKTEKILGGEIEFNCDYDIVDIISKLIGWTGKYNDWICDVIFDYIDGYIDIDETAEKLLRDFNEKDILEYDKTQEEYYKKMNER